MEILPFKFQATLFCNNDDIRPDAHLVQALFNGLLKWEIFPNFTKELKFQVSGLNAAKPQQVDRLQFISSDKLKRINFLGNRIDFEYFITSQSSVISIDEFMKNSLEQFAIINKVLRKTFNRLSLVCLYYCPKKDVNYLDQLYNETFKKPISIEGKTNPHEWNTKSAYTGIMDINGKMERMNYNISFGRKIQHGNGYLSNEDRLEFMFDLNTHQNQTSFRFNDKDVYEFYSKITEKTKELTILTIGGFK